jgi:hypothetical protein
LVIFPVISPLTVTLASLLRCTTILMIETP